MFVRKNSAGAVCGCFRVKQEPQQGMTDVELPDDHPDVLAFLSPTPEQPQSVSRFQARAALHLAGLLPRVEALMADPATPVLARMAWQDAQQFCRHSPTVLAMSAALGLTDAQVDALFTQASQIEA